MSRKRNGLAVEPETVSPPAQWEEVNPKKFVVGHDEPLPERSAKVRGSKYPFAELKEPYENDGVKHCSYIEADRQTIKSLTSSARQYAKSHPGTKFITRVVNADLARVIRVE